MDPFKYLIVGGGLAAGRACDGIRKVDPEGSIALVTAEPYPPYHRPPLSKGYLAGTKGLDSVRYKENGYYAENHIELIRGVRATAIDRAARRVTLADGRVLGYERLLLATGGRAWRLPIPGADLPGVFTLRTRDDSEAIREAAASAKTALVLGGSFIGSETAASLTQLGLKVTMVFPESRLLEAIVPEELSAFLQEKYGGQGIEIRTGAKPLRLEGNGQVGRAILDDGQTLDVDLVVMGVGIRLNTELASAAGLEMWEKSAVVVDEFLRTSDPHIYAAGDIAAWPDPTYGRRLRVEHWDVAWRQGLRAGRNMAGEEKRYTTLPYFFSDLFDFSFEVWGDLTGWEQTVRRGTVQSASFAFYYFCEGKLAGVLAMGRPDEERGPMEALVKARPAFAEVAPQLADDGVALSSLVR